MLQQDIHKRDEQGFMLLGVIVLIFLVMLALSVAAPKAVAHELRRDHARWRRSIAATNTSARSSCITRSSRTLSRQHWISWRSRTTLAFFVRNTMTR